MALISASSSYSWVSSRWKLDFFGLSHFKLEIEPKSHFFNTPSQGVRDPGPVISLMGRGNNVLICDDTKARTLDWPMLQDQIYSPHPPKKNYLALARKPEFRLLWKEQVEPGLQFCIVKYPIPIL